MAYRHKRRELSTRDVILLLDNSAGTYLSTRSIVQIYYPATFMSLDRSRSQKFNDEAEVEAYVPNWLHKRPTSLYKVVNSMGNMCFESKRICFLVMSNKNLTKALFIFDSPSEHELLENVALKVSLLVWEIGQVTESHV